MSDPVAPLKAILERLKSGAVLRFAVTETQAKIAGRVFDDGKLTSGGDVSYKQDYEVWAYQPPSPKKVSGKGKPGKDGKSRKIKGGYYPTYLDYKDSQSGRGPFELTGRMKSAFTSALSIVDVSPTRIQIVLKGENAAKYEGLTDTKGEFLSPSASEVLYFKDRLNAAL